MNKTIAVIGAGGKMGAAISWKLASAGHRILLIDQDLSEAAKTFESIKSFYPQADVEVLNCAHEASWEADIIIPAVAYEAQEGVARKIQEVVTGKIVVSITNPVDHTIKEHFPFPDGSAAEELQKLLPCSSVVKAFNTTPPDWFYESSSSGKKADCFIAGDDPKAVLLVSGLVKEAGFNPLYTGKLATSRTLEGMMAILTSLNGKNHYHKYSGFKLVSLNH